MTGPPPESLAAWSKALASMRRGSPIYKPAVLLAALDVLDQGKATPDAIPYPLVSQRFSEIVGQVKPSARSKAWDPFSRLEGDNVWKVRAAEADAASAQARETQVASFSSTLRSALDTPDGRKGVRTLVRNMLEKDAKDDSRRLLEVDQQ